MRTKRGSHHFTHLSGFTLLESVVALVIAAVLASATVPAARRMLAHYQLQGAQNELIAALQHARYQAIHSRRRTVLCPSTDGRQCLDSIHWERGWALGNYRSNQADQWDGPPLLTHAGYAQLNIISTEGRKRVRFQPDGSAGGSTVTFTLCRPGQTQEALALTISNQGRVASAKVKPADAANCAASS